MSATRTTRIPVQISRASSTVTAGRARVTGAVLNGYGWAVVEVDLTGFGPDLVRAVLRAVGHPFADVPEQVARLVRQRGVMSHLTLRLPASAADDFASELADAAAAAEELNTDPRAYIPG